MSFHYSIENRMHKNHMVENHAVESFIIENCTIRISYTLSINLLDKLLIEPICIYRNDRLL